MDEWRDERMAGSDSTGRRYVVVVEAVQNRIRSGVYAPGEAIPSENELATEFGLSRSTVVYALKILHARGWVDAEQGRGRFVRSRVPDRLPPTRVAEFFGRESGGVRVVRAAAVLAPPRVAAALGLPEDSAVYMRQRLVLVEGLGPIELGCAYVPVDLGVGTGVTSFNPLADGLLRHLTQVKGVEWDYARDAISTLLPTPEQAQLLEISLTDPLLRVFTTVYDRAGRPRLAADVVMPGTRYELDDEYRVS